MIEQDVALLRLVIDGELHPVHLLDWVDQVVVPRVVLRVDDHVRTGDVCRIGLPHLIVGALEGLSAHRPAPQVGRLHEAHLQLDLVEADQDVARRERAVDDAVLVLAEIEVARLHVAELDVPARRRRLLEIVAGIRLDDDRGTVRRDRVTVVAQRRLDDGRRIILHLFFADQMRDEASGDAHLERRVTQFREGRPAILVTVGVRIVERTVRTHAVLFVVFHEVVVRVDFAQIAAIVHLEEVVGLELVGARTRQRRVEHGDARRFDPVFGEVRETVVVRVGSRVGRRTRVDAVEVLPPVGYAVLVVIARVGVLGMVLRVAEHAVCEVSQIGLPSRHGNALVDDGRIPPKLLARRQLGVVVAGVLLPPIGQRVVVGVGSGLGPGVGRAAVVPHASLERRDALREGAAHRQQVAADHQAVAVGEAVALLENRILGDEVPAGLFRVGLLPCREAHLDLARPDFRRAREVELRIAGRRCRIVSGVIFAPVDGVGRRAVEERQVRDRVVDPRDPGTLGVDLRADRFERTHPLVAIARWTRPRGHRVLLGPVRREAGRRLEHFAAIHRARHVVERPVVAQFGRKSGRRVAGRRAESALRPGCEDRLAVLLRQRRRVAHAALVVLLDVLGRTRAVPDADFVDVALEERRIVGERRLERLVDVRPDGRDLFAARFPCIVEPDAAEVRGRRADEEGDHPLAGRSRAPANRIVELGRAVDDERRRAVLGPDGRLDRVAKDAVDVEPESHRRGGIGLVARLGPERRRHMRPVGGRERTVGDLHRLALVRARRVELRVPTAVVDADEEVLAQVALVARVRRTRPDHALDHRVASVRTLADNRSIGLHPGLDRVVEEVLARLRTRDLERHRVGERQRRLQERVRTVEPHRLVADRVVVLLRVGRDLRLALRLLEVAKVVVVAVIALVLLVAEERVAVLDHVHVPLDRERLGERIVLEPRELVKAVRLALELERALRDALDNGERVRPPRVLRLVEAVRQRVSEGCVGHPQRRRVGVLVRARRLDLGENRLLLVADVVAVRIGRRQAREPRELVEVHQRHVRIAQRGPRGTLRERAVHDLASVDPVVRRRGVRIQLGIRAPRDVDDVEPLLARDHPLGPSEQRVQAVEDLIEVVHAVVVCVGVARIAADVLLGVERHARLVRVIGLRDLVHQHRPTVLRHAVHHADVEPQVVVDTVAEHVEVVVDRALDILQPRQTAAREVDARVEVAVAEAGVVGHRVIAVGGSAGVRPAAEEQVAPPGVPVLGLHAVRDVFRRHDVVGPRRGHVVIAPAAHRADHVLLPVLETVVVVVLVLVGRRRIHAVLLCARERRDRVRHRRRAVRIAVRLDRRGRRA